MSPYCLVNFYFFLYSSGRKQERARPGRLLRQKRVEPSTTCWTNARSWTNWKETKSDLQVAAFHLEKLLKMIPFRSRTVIPCSPQLLFSSSFFFAPLRSLPSNHNPAPHFKRKNSTNAAQREVAVAAFQSIMSREAGEKGPRWWGTNRRAGAFVWMTHKGYRAPPPKKRPRRCHLPAVIDSTLSMVGHWKKRIIRNHKMRADILNK